MLARIIIRANRQKFWSWCDLSDTSSFKRIHVSHVGGLSSGRGRVNMGVGGRNVVMICVMGCVKWESYPCFYCCPIFFVYYLVFVLIESI